MRAILQVGYAVRRAIFGLIREPTVGVKVMLFNGAGEVLLVRNSYGNSRLFLLPGGGVSSRESPAQAAIREMREELGVDIGEPDLAWTYRSGAEGKRDTIHLFRAAASGEIHIDDVEVVEAKYFDLDSLPETTSPATRRRIAEISGERAYDGRW
ncbi:MAG TPA: NUDIX domain-containing protein [Sphingomicrobium sp.]|nr:NUDIX domain-containing protein [Sphingomicrobium sp.]